MDLYSAFPIIHWYLFLLKYVLFCFFVRHLESAILNFSNLTVDLATLQTRFIVLLSQYIRNIITYGPNGKIQNFWVFQPPFWDPPSWISISNAVNFEEKISRTLSIHFPPTFLIEFGLKILIFRKKNLKKTRIFAEKANITYKYQIFRQNWWQIRKVREKIHRYWFFLFFSERLFVDFTKAEKM